VGGQITVLPLGEDKTYVVPCFISFLFALGSIVVGVDLF
jgi:hypothetical protein